MSILDWRATLTHLNSFFSFHSKKNVVEDKIRILTTEDKSIIMKAALGAGGRTRYFINSEYKVLNLNEFIKNFEYYYNLVVKSSKPIDIVSIPAKYTGANFISNTINVDSIRKFNKINLDDLIALVSSNNIVLIQSELSSLRKLFGEVSAKLDNSKDTLMVNKLSIQYEMLKHKLSIYMAIIGFYRIVYSYLEDGFIFSTNIPRGTKLFHISSSDKIKSPMVPQLISSAEFKEDDAYYPAQILPERISFAPSIVNAFYGACFRVFDKNNNGEYIFGVQQIDNNIYTAKYHVYEGKVNFKTTMVKEEYARETIHEWDISKEICVTSPIDIKYLGVVEVTFKNGTGPVITNAFGEKIMYDKMYLSHKFIK